MGNTSHPFLVKNSVFIYLLFLPFGTTNPRPAKIDILLE